MRRYETECDLRRWDFKSSALPTELPSQRMAKINPTILPQDLPGLQALKNV